MEKENIVNNKSNDFLLKNHIKKSDVLCITTFNINLYKKGNKLFNFVKKFANFS